jgi:hypothetical protein
MAGRFTRAARGRASPSFRSVAPTEDTRNVQGAALDARENRCSVLVFSRDVDSDPRRSEAVERGIARASAPGLQVVGAAAVPAIEGWLLALRGRDRTESLGRAAAKREISDLDPAPESLAELVSASDLAEAPVDARSLRVWLDRAREAFRE